MPTSDFVAAALAEQTGEIVITLMTLSHPDMGTPLRVTSDSVQTVSRGNTFIAYPFALSLMRQSDESGAPVARLAISNVDRRIVEALRSLPLEPAIAVLIESVLASDPDVVEDSLVGLELRGAEFNVQRVTGDISINVLDREPYPYRKYLPSTVPGVF